MFYYHIHDPALPRIDPSSLFYSILNVMWIFRWVLCDAELTTARKYCGAAVHNGRIYVVGGRDKSNNYLNTVEWLDGGSWRLSEPMNKKRNGVSLVECGGVLFAIGGWSGSLYENSFEILKEV